MPERGRIGQESTPPARGPPDPPFPSIDLPPTCHLPPATCLLPPALTRCAFCGRDNDPAAKFCIDCGKPMTVSGAGKAAAMGETVSGVSHEEKQKFGVPATRVSQQPKAHASPPGPIPAAPPARPIPARPRPLPLLQHRDRPVAAVLPEVREPARGGSTETDYIDCRLRELPHPGHPRRRRLLRELRHSRRGHRRARPRHPPAPPLSVLSVRRSGRRSRSSTPPVSSRRPRSSPVPSARSAATTASCDSPTTCT